MSCKIITPRRPKSEIEYRLNFDVDESGGYSFPCDANGKILKDINPYALKNYHECLLHPEKFIRKAYIEKREYNYTENAIAQCICGETFELWDQYQGACACPNCNRWYNLFGQELLNPEYWEDN